MVTVKYATLALKRLSGGQYVLSQSVSRSIHVPSIHIRGRHRLSIPSDHHMYSTTWYYHSASIFSLSENYRNLPVHTNTEWLNREKRMGR